MTFEEGDGAVPGTHTVVMSHTSPGLRTGLLVSLIAAVAIAALWAFSRRGVPEGAKLRCHFFGQRNDSAAGLAGAWRHQ